jgi:beta-hydroxyacyl-ACP dehydratase FabZ
MESYKYQKLFSIQDILKILPHRFPFILIDKVKIIDLGRNLVATKNVTINEPFFQGHFPNQPVLPGVLTIEMMAQAGSFLILSQVENPLSKNMFFSAVEKARFTRPIIPGDKLEINVALDRKKLGLYKFKGECFVDNEVVAKANFSAKIVDRVQE